MLSQNAFADFCRLIQSGRAVRILRFTNPLSVYNNVLAYLAFLSVILEFPEKNGLAELKSIDESFEVAS
jgi:hypothetical protein